ncbi:response regulator [Lentzea sp. NPDC051838]|uniref:response regulator n=1 Tax=Lentzea sp. NPDC051838 TaxID=3154849 RepID=UPI003445EBBD
MVTVLVVDHEPQAVHELRDALIGCGHDVLVAEDGETALDIASSGKPDVVVLDPAMPDTDPVELIADLRERTPVPVIVLSERPEPTYKVSALDAGADDYVTKPFDLEELLARLRAFVRRANAEVARDPVVIAEAFTVDLGAKRVYRKGVEVHLTPNEWAVLEVLVRNSGRLVSHHRLLREVWGPDRVGELQYLRVYLAQLRRKLEDDPSRPRHLITEPGLGHRFEL